MHLRTLINSIDNHALIKFEEEEGKEKRERAGRMAEASCQVFKELQLKIEAAASYETGIKPKKRYNHRHLQCQKNRRKETTKGIIL